MGASASMSGFRALAAALKRATFAACPALLAPFVPINRSAIAPIALPAIGGGVVRDRLELAAACSLHPLGLPFAERLPDGVADFSLEVRGQPDQYAVVTVPEDELAWRSAEATLTQTELAVARESTQRRLLRPSTPWATARDGIVAALIGGGSVVVVVGDDESALERIRETENIEGEVG